MSEAMAIESITEEFLKFLGYFTETRVHFKKERGGNSDIDVLGYNPKTKKTIAVECKAYGGPDNYFNYDTDKRFLEIEGLFDDLLDGWGRFTDKESKTNKWGFKRLDAMWIVIPGYCEKKEEYKEILKKKFKQEIEIIPIHELIKNLINEVKKDKNLRRKRYSNPALELFRWLLRSHKKGYFDLTDLDSTIKEEKQSYRILRENYFRNCIRIVNRNYKKSKGKIKTRINTLKILSKLEKNFTRKQIEEEAKKQEIKLGKNVNNGLSTWIELGIILKDNDKKYYINEAFREIIKKEIKNY
jgi:hypothetical protein